MIHEEFVDPPRELGLCPFWFCRANGIALMGHPEAPDDPSPLRFFDVPGQDLVWRWVLPGPTATVGLQSAQAKADASGAKHRGARRNSNELPDLRVRHVRKAGQDLWLVFNEGGDALDLPLARDYTAIHPIDLEVVPTEGRLKLSGFELVMLVRHSKSRDWFVLAESETPSMEPAGNADAPRTWTAFVRAQSPTPVDEIAAPRA